MLKDQDKIFTNLSGANSPYLHEAKKRGDWSEVKTILSLGPEKIIEEIKESGLRGRGGAGFSTGMKWSFMPKNHQGPVYLIVNADESEPGTCKDRDIIRYEPHKIIEGALISSFAIQATKCFIYIRGEYVEEAKILEKAIHEAYSKGLIGNKASKSDYNLDIILHRGAGAYICGEETALLSSLEGKKGFPRLKPPFPAMYGLYGDPTTINNVESIAVVGTIMRRGAKWFKSLGVKNSTGTKIFQFLDMLIILAM